MNRGFGLVGNGFGLVAKGLGLVGGGLQPSMQGSAGYRRVSTQLRAVEPRSGSCGCWTSKGVSLSPLPPFGLSLIQSGSN